MGLATYRQSLFNTSYVQREETLELVWDLGIIFLLQHDPICETHVEYYVCM
jgi:hypothetical protein